MARKKPWIVVAGGGTAGHVLPALAVAESLRSQGVPSDDMLFVGSQRGIENRLVPEAGFPIVLLPGRGIQRAFRLSNLRNLLALGAAFLRAFVLLARSRPAVVLSVGGYASVPCAFSAVALRIPLVLAESNAKAGMANRSVARFAKATATAFGSTGLPRASVVGNPVRSSVAELGASLDPSQHGSTARASSRHDLGVPVDAQMVSVFGGSLGARRINATVFELCERWVDRPIVIHHVVGERDADAGSQWLATFRDRHRHAVLDYRQIRYENRMDLVYGASDLVVCRAGATSIADLATVGMPAILIPLPSAAEDHQSANAAAVATDGACVHLPEKELSVERLASEIDALLNDHDRMRSMADAQRRRARPNAAFDVTAILAAHASRPMPHNGAASANGLGKR